MKKFFILIKKEILELLTPQTIVPLLAIVLIFMFLGKVIGKEAAKTKAPQQVALLDLDNSATSQNVIQILKQNNLAINVYFEGDAKKTIEEAKQKNQKTVLVINSGFGEGIKNQTPQKIDVYTIMKNFSFTGSISASAVSAALGMVNESLSNQMLSAKSPGADILALKRPILTNDFVLIGERQANVSPAAVSGFISSQTTFIPIILFLVIVFASQLIVTSIASEKENKTLETLLSSPISRQSIVAAKLIAAGVVSLLTAVFYLFGMRYYLNSLTFGGQATAVSDATKSVMAQLGLTFGTSDYLLLGVSLFFGILAALSVAIILGSFAEDTKSAQGVITPLMVLILIPYFLTMFLDISSLSTGVRWLVYLIPFSHPFLAAPNILLGQYQNVWFGILYLALFFLVFVYLASKIFASEHIFTMRIRLKAPKKEI